MWPSWYGFADKTSWGQGSVPQLETYCVYSSASSLETFLARIRGWGSFWQSKGCSWKWHHFRLRPPLASARGLQGDKRGYSGSSCRIEERQDPAQPSCGHYLCCHQLLEVEAHAFWWNCFLKNQHQCACLEGISLENLSCCSSKRRQRWWQILKFKDLKCKGLDESGRWANRPRKLFKGRICSWGRQSCHQLERNERGKIYEQARNWRVSS